MFHLVLTAHNNGIETSVHVTLREADESGEFHTVATRGGVVPGLSGGLLGDGSDAFLKAAERALGSFIIQVSATRQ